MQGTGKWGKLALWMRKFWTHIDNKLDEEGKMDNGMKLQQFLEQAQGDYKEWKLINRANKKQKLDDGETRGKKGFKEWAESL